MAKSDADIIASYDNSYSVAYNALSAFYPMAQRDLGFYLGDQWSQSEKHELISQGRNAFVVNKIRPRINMVTGYQRKHRHSSVVVPIEGADQQAADQLTKLLLYAFQYGHGYETISDCFGGAVTTGWNLGSLWLDYRTDPVDGDICFGREPYNSFITDPFFSKRDLTDCSYIIRRKMINLNEAQSLLPKYAKDLEYLLGRNAERDDKFSWLPYQRSGAREDLLAYDEFWEQGYEEQQLTVNRYNGEILPFDGNRQRLIIQPELEIIKRRIPYVDRHIIVNRVYFETEHNPYGLNEYPFVPFLCVFAPESDDYSLKIQSLVRVMIDPQVETNKRRSQMTDIVESQINSGWIATENSIVNERALFQTSQGRVIWKTDSPNAILEKIQPAQVPPSFFQLTELFDKDVGDVGNITDELIGQADSQEDSGLKVMLRQSAALVGLQDIFDNLRFAQECLSRKVLKIAQHWSDKKMARILGEEPSQAIKNKETLKYDISVQEGVLTNTQQALFFRQMVDLKQLGEPIPPGFLAKIAPLQGKTEYMKAMDEFNQQQAQASQQAAQQAEQAQQAQTQLFQSQSLSNIATAKEHMTRAISNMGSEDERVSQAAENRADATLKRAQAMAQLQAMDDDRLVKLVQFFHMLEERQIAKEEQLKADNVQVTQSLGPTQQPLEAPNEGNQGGLGGGTQPGQGIQLRPGEGLEA